MNAERRKEITSIKDRLDDIKQDIVSLQEQEQEAFDNLPESLQGGEKGEKSQSAIDSLESAVNSFDEIEYSLDEAAAA